jgi:uncharacterized protein (TIGR04255 family)
MEAQAARSALPEYDNPPVSEVVCGVLFKTLEGFKVAHFGLFWERCKAEYPQCQDVPPLLPAIEGFGEPQEEASIQFPDTPRVWFINSEDTGLIQLQRDRFLHNWKKAKPSDSYPRYHTVIAQFKRHLESFDTFVRENKLGTIDPLQYEITYVNHMPAGLGWNDISELGRVFRHHQYRATAKRFLPVVETANLKTTFALPNRTGRLHASIKTGIRKEDSKPIIVFELTVRGLPTDRAREAMWGWFDVGREWIVRGFTDLTTEEIQTSVWRRTR